MINYINESLSINDIIKKSSNVLNFLKPKTTEEVAVPIIIGTGVSYFFPYIGIPLALISYGIYKSGDYFVDHNKNEKIEKSINNYLKSQTDQQLNLPFLSEVSARFILSKFNISEELEILKPINKDLDSINIKGLFSYLLSISISTAYEFSKNSAETIISNSPILKFLLTNYKNDNIHNIISNILNNNLNIENFLLNSNYKFNKEEINQIEIFLYNLNIKDFNEFYNECKSYNELITKFSKSLQSKSIDNQIQNIKNIQRISNIDIKYYTDKITDDSLINLKILLLWICDQFKIHEPFSTINNIDINYFNTSIDAIEKISNNRDITYKNINKIYIFILSQMDNIFSNFNKKSSDIFYIYNNTPIGDLQKSLICIFFLYTITSKIINQNIIKDKDSIATDPLIIKNVKSTLYQILKSKNIQSKINVDSLYDDDTINIIKYYQQLFNINPDGVLSKQFIDRLENYTKELLLGNENI